MGFQNCVQKRLCHVLIDYLDRLQCTVFFCNIDYYFLMLVRIDRQKLEFFLSQKRKSIKRHFFFFSFSDVNLRYVCNDPSVCIKSNVNDENFKYVIQQMKLSVTKVKLVNSVKLAIEKNLSAGHPALYSFRQILNLDFFLKF